jgi:hypothetical protein
MLVQATGIYGFQQVTSTNQSACDAKSHHNCLGCQELSYAFWRFHICIVLVEQRQRSKKGLMLGIPAFSLREKSCGVP